MKILTITCHKVYNHGASLQQFALLYFLNNSGFEAKTINYQPKYLAEIFSYYGVANPKFKKNLFLKLLYVIAKLPSKINDIKRRNAFNDFEKNFIPSTDKLFVNNIQLKNNTPKADAYICGSDQIWNSLLQNGKDPAFYLDFVANNKKKISYAASFAIDNVSDEWKDFVKEKVNRIDYISVRENSGLRILENMGINRAVQVLDPVFLISKKEWEKLFIKNKEVEPYVLVYDFENDEIIKNYALYLKEKNGWKIFALSKKIKYADEVFWSIGPDKFLNLLYHSHFVLANSFHATAFSVIFGKQFLIFNRQIKINTRMRDFLQDFGLQERLVSQMDKKLVTQKIDFNQISHVLENKIQYSKNFLLNTLNNERMDK